MMLRRLGALAIAVAIAAGCNSPASTPAASGPPGSGGPVAPHAEDPSLGPDPTLLMPSATAVPVAPDVELGTLRPDPTVSPG
jgi:hypothetical protein